MSGRNLPDRCSKSGAAFCAWQFPTVAMTAATDSKSYAERWSVTPGFLDPFHVVYCCVKRLKAETFVNVKYKSKISNSTAPPDKSKLCIGLQIYLNKMIKDDQVSHDVKEHIETGSAENVAATIRRYPCTEQVLLFLMKYLKERGPLMKFKYNDTEFLNSVAFKTRCLVNTFMTTLCEHELEFQAAVVIGDYLNFVLFVAYAHDLFWMKDIIVDAWAPLLIELVNVGLKTADNLTPSQRLEKSKSLMHRMIETVPWEKLKTQENFKITINPQINDSNLKRKATEAAHQREKLTQKPIAQETLIGEANILDLLSTLDDVAIVTKADDNEDPAAAVAREAAEEKAKKMQEAAKKKREVEEKNKDYSHLYNYSPKFLAEHAPHGMCPVGFDPTIT